ncbi:MAG: TlpA disulfide reductase family protein [Candidatus Brocadiia bacterium]
MRYVAVLCLAAFLSVSLFAPAEGNRAEVGKPFVDFTAKTWDDKEFSLSQAISGKTAIIKFGAIWCGYCERMWPELKKINDEMKNVVIIEVDILSTEKGETREKVAASVKSKKTPWTVVLDEGSIFQIYNVEGQGGIPQTAFIGPDGTYRKTLVGGMTFEAMKPIITAVSKSEPLPGEVGAMFPDFTLTAIDDKEYKLAAALKKGPVVVKFGATWCGPCQQMIPVLNKLLEKYSKKATIWELDLLSAERKETKEKVKEHNKKSGAKYQILYDDEGKIFGQMGVGGIPYTVVIDKFGRISATFEGVTQYEAVEAALEAAFNAKKPETKKPEKKPGESPKP